MYELEMPILLIMQLHAMDGPARVASKLSRERQSGRESRIGVVDQLIDLGHQLLCGMALVGTETSTHGDAVDTIALVFRTADAVGLVKQGSSFVSLEFLKNCSE